LDDLAIVMSDSSAVFTSSTNVTDGTTINASTTVTAIAFTGTQRLNGMHLFFSVQRKIDKTVEARTIKEKRQEISKRS
jgi:hypothetical protein